MAEAYREKVLNYVQKTYKVKPDYPWARYQDSAVLRHSDTGKWFGLIMPAPKSYLGLGEDGYEDVINIKCEPMLIDSLIQKAGYYRAYHMNKTQWLSILLDGTVPNESIYDLIDMSYKLTDKRKCN